MAMESLIGMKCLNLLKKFHRKAKKMRKTEKNNRNKKNFKLKLKKHK